MSALERQPLETPRAWLRRLEQINSAELTHEQQRVHLHYLADARRLVQQEQQKERWDQEK
jgi:hypothetical protein